MRYVAADPRVPQLKIDAVNRFLRSGRKVLRLAFIDKGGDPAIRSLWFLYEGGELLTVVPKGSTLHRAVQRRREVYFTVDTRKRRVSWGVRGKGLAQVSTRPSVVARVVKGEIHRYLGNGGSSRALQLIKAVNGGNLVVIRIIPKYLASWDYAPEDEVRHKPDAAG